MRVKDENTDPKILKMNKFYLFFLQKKKKVKVGHMFVMCSLNRRDSADSPFTNPTKTFYFSLFLLQFSSYLRK